MKHYDFLVELIKENPDIHIMAEVGVWKGKMTTTILQACSDQLTQYWAIDQWCLMGLEHGRMGRKNMKHWDAYYEYVLSQQMNYPQLRVFRDTSENVAKSLDGDSHFDFVYLDADHRYDETMAGIKEWRPLVRNGGILGGHGYGMRSEKRKGATIAVDECFPDEKVQTGPDSVWFIHIDQQ